MSKEKKKNLGTVIFWVIILIIFGFFLHGKISEWKSDSYDKDIQIISYKTEVGYNRFEKEIITYDEISRRLDNHIDELDKLEKQIKGNIFLKGYQEKSLLRDIEFNKIIARKYKSLI